MMPSTTLFQSVSARSWHNLKKYERHVNLSIFIKFEHVFIQSLGYDGAINLEFTD